MAITLHLGPNDAPMLRAFYEFQQSFCTACLIHRLRHWQQELTILMSLIRLSECRDLLQDLPPDLLDRIMAILEADHMKQLRLTSRHLRSASVRHITRVEVAVTPETQASVLDNQLCTLSCVTHVALRCDALQDLASVVLGCSRVIPLLGQLFVRNCEALVPSSLDDLRQASGLTLLDVSATQASAINEWFKGRSTISFCHVESLCALLQRCCSLRDLVLDNRWMEWPCHVLREQPNAVGVHISALTALQRLHVRDSHALLPQHLSTLHRLTEISGLRLEREEDGPPLLARLPLLQKLHVEIMGDPLQGYLLGTHSLVELSLCLPGYRSVWLTSGSPLFAKLAHVTRLQALTVQVTFLLTESTPWEELCAAVSCAISLTRFEVIYFWPQGAGLPLSALAALNLPCLQTLAVPLALHIATMHGGEKLWGLLAARLPALQDLSITFCHAADYRRVAGCGAGPLLGLTRLQAGVQPSMFSEPLPPQPDDWPTAEFAIRLSGLKHALLQLCVSNAEQDIPMLAALARDRGMHACFNLAPECGYHCNEFWDGVKKTPGRGHWTDNLPGEDLFLGDLPRVWRCMDVPQEAAWLVCLSPWTPDCDREFQVVQHMLTKEDVELMHSWYPVRV